MNITAKLSIKMTWRIKQKMQSCNREIAIVTSLFYLMGKDGVMKKATWECAEGSGLC